MALYFRIVYNGRKIFHILAALLVWGAQISRAELGLFGFDIHHRYSDTVKKSLKIDDGMPEKDTCEFYKSMVHHDRRRLAGKVDSTTLAFAAGDETVRIDELAFMHYANISVGTPSLSFLVALDTGSDLAWLPCDCINCARRFIKRRGKRLDFNIYSPTRSTTSKIVPCTSSKCVSGLCVEGTNDCYYQIKYLDGSSSTGMIVEDMLHSVKNDDQRKPVDASITLGCGISQTGGFLTRGGINGLLGLGTDNLSVPSILASKGLVADSFSMCFGPDGFGRIVFGDKGSSDQGETPFFVHELIPTYTVTMTQVFVGGSATNLLFTAIFDSGTSFTYLDDPAYRTITSSFNNQVRDSRYNNISSIAFEYCYNLRATSSGPETPNIPKLSFTMKGGKRFNVTAPVAIFSKQERDGYIYCLTVIKTVNTSIIGQNFMTGHRLVFDRERMILGWKESECYDGDNSGPGLKTQPPPPFHDSPMRPPSLSPPPPQPTNRSTHPPPPLNQRNFRGGPSTDIPEDTDGFPFTRSSGSAVRLSSFTCRLVMVLVSLLSHCLIVFPS